MHGNNIFMSRNNLFKLYLYYTVMSAIAYYVYFYLYDSMSVIAKICTKLSYSYLGRTLLIPSHQIKYVGQTASFHCITLRDTKWRFLGGPLPNNVVITKYDRRIENSADRLTIKNVNINNRGKYTCIMGEDFLEAEGVLDVIGKTKNCILAL